MSYNKKRLLETVLLLMEKKNRTFEDIAVTYPNKETMTYGELFKQIENEEGYGLRCINAFEMVKKYGRQMD